MIAADPAAAPVFIYIYLYIYIYIHVHINVNVTRYKCIHVNVCNIYIYKFIDNTHTHIYIYTHIMCIYIGGFGKVIRNESISAPYHGWYIASPLYPHHISRDPTTLMNHDESYLQHHTPPVFYHAQSRV